MHDTRTRAPDRNASTQLHRRVKRGIVAGYIHELSARHSTDARTLRSRAEAAAVAPPAHAQATRA